MVSKPLLFSVIPLLHYELTLSGEITHFHSCNVKTVKLIFLLEAIAFACFYTTDLLELSANAPKLIDSIVKMHTCSAVFLLLCRWILTARVWQQHRLPFLDCKFGLSHFHHGLIWNSHSQRGPFPEAAAARLTGLYPAPVTQEGFPVAKRAPCCPTCAGQHTERV